MQEKQVLTIESQLEMVARHRDRETLPAYFGADYDPALLMRGFLDYGPAQLREHVDRLLHIVGSDQLVQCPCCPEAMVAARLAEHFTSVHEGMVTAKPYAGRETQWETIEMGVSAEPTLGQVKQMIERAYELAAVPGKLDQAIFLLQRAGHCFPFQRRRLTPTLVEWQERSVSLHPEEFCKGYGLSMDVPIACADGSAVNTYLESLMCPWREPSYFAPVQVHVGSDGRGVEEFQVCCVCDLHSLRLYVAPDREGPAIGPGSVGWTLGDGLPSDAKAEQKAKRQLWSRILSEGRTCPHCGHCGQAYTGFRMSLGKQGILVICRSCGHPQ